MAWYLLIHQLPPKPLYLRAKIRSRLAGVGGVALKNSVYVLPERDDCLEDLEWIAQEAVSGGGEAYVCRAEFLEGVSDQTLQKRFRDQASQAYDSFKRELTEALARARQRGPEAAEVPGDLLRLKKRFEDISSLDFFEAPERKETEAMLRVLESRIHGDARKAGAKAPRKHPDLIGRTWVTRRDPRVDRLGSAWLIRRFVDPGARFRFLDPRRLEKRPSEIGFDFVGADFTHERDRCTFETLKERIGISDPALDPIAEIVHDIDLKDGKYGRPDGPGIQQLIQGLIQAHPNDEERIASGLVLFDHLYASFRGKARASRVPAANRKRTQRRR